MRPWSDELDLFSDLLSLNEEEYKRLIGPARRDSKLVPAVKRLLRLRLLRKGINPDNPPPIGLPRDLSTSDYPLGHAKCGEVVGEEVGLSQEDIQAGGGIGTFGLSGTGKSTLVKIFLLKFSGKAI